MDKFRMSGRVCDPNPVLPVVEGFDEIITTEDTEDHRENL